MKKRLLILPLLAGFALSSCSIQDLMFWKKKEQQPSGEQTPSASVTSVTISGAKTSLALGETMQLTANVTVTGDAAKTVTWSTSAAAKATVSASGLVTAKGLGEVTVTATSTVDSSKSASVTFTVASPTWSATTKALFEEYFEDVPPAFTVPTSLTWTDDYFEDYDCLSAEGSGNSVSTVTANIEMTGAYTKVSTSSSTSTDYTAPSADPDYEWYIQVYYSSSSKTCIDVYMYPVEYSAWPSEVVTAHLAKLEFTTAEIPAFSSQEALVYTCVYQKLETGEDVVFINVYGEAQATEPDLTSEDYVPLFNSEKYEVFEIEGGYQVQAKDKSHSVLVYDQEMGIDWETFSYVYYPGFQVIVTPYIPNYAIDIEEQYEMIAVGDSLDLTLVKGEDIPAEAVIGFTSSDSGIASVDASGHVEGVAVGSATITATYAAQEVTATTLVYVVESIPTAFTAEQLAEFDKIHGEGVVSAPFNKYFETAAFANDVLSITGKEVSHEIIESYYEDLITAGWEDENAYLYSMYVLAGYAADEEEAREMVFEYSGKYELSKTFADKYVVYGDLYASAYDEEEEAEGLAYDGNIHFDVYDVFVYTYEEALDSFEAALTNLGYESLPTFPEALPASRFGIDADNYGVDFYAFDTEVTLELLKTALEGKGFTCEIKEETEEVDEDSEEEPEVTKVLYASALEGEFELSAVYYEDDEVLAMHVDKKASGHWADTLADLKDGDEFCIFSYGYGLGALDGTYFTAVEAIDENNYYDPDTEGLLHLILEKDGEVWHIKDEDGNYYGDNSKKITTSKTITGTNFDWTIEFDEDTYAIFSCNGFDLLFNTSSPRFKTYDSGMSNGASYYVYVYEE